MIWLRSLYWGDRARTRGKNLVRAAEGGEASPLDSCWLITLSVYPAGQLDLFKLSDLRSRLFSPGSMTVLGLAEDKKEALALLEQMTKDCLKATGRPQLGSYFASLPTTDWRGVRV